MKNMHLVIFAISVGVLILIGCQNNERKQVDLSKYTTEELLTIVKSEEEPYLIAIAELGERPEDGSISGPVLTEALSRKRRDYYQAGIAIIKLGQSAKVAVPDLSSVLDDENPGTRAYAAFALASIGSPAKCAVPKLAVLMWDKDGEVRVAAASAIDSIMEIDLVYDLYQTDPNKPYGISSDSPEGSITKRSRDWWLIEGSKETWPETCIIDD